MNFMKLFPVILCGGAGTRLWPVSRQSHPKPFMRIGGDESLLQQTVARAIEIAGPHPEITLVLNKDYFFMARDELSRFSSIASLRYFLEPFGRNTAPAITCATSDICARRGDDSIILVLPADHLALSLIHI